MKHFILMIVCLSTVQNVFSQNVKATGSTLYTHASPLDLHNDQNKKQMVMADILNVRTTASPRSEVIGKIKEGSIVNITAYEKGSSFSKVMYADGTDVKEGYVSVDYLTPLFLVNDRHRSYVRVDVVKKEDYYQEELKLYEVTSSGRKELLSKTDYASGQLSISLLDTPDLDSIHQIITLQRTENDCCECGVTSTHIVQGLSSSEVLPEYRFEMDDSGNEVIYKVHLANEWDQEEYDIAIIKGTWDELESGSKDSLQVVEKYMWKGKGLVNVKPKI